MSWRGALIWEPLSSPLSSPSSSACSPERIFLSKVSCSVCRKRRCEIGIPRGTVIGKRIGVQPTDEADHFFRCETKSDTRNETT
jgi:hypothetical protein